MAGEFGFYADSGLTAPLTSVQVVQASDGSSAAVERVVYLGSTLAGKKYQAASDPGSASIAVSVADSATGGGVQASHVKLASSQAGLAAATPSAAAVLGTQILSGAGNAVAFWMRVDTPALTAGEYADVSFSTNSLIELPV